MIGKHTLFLTLIIYSSCTFCQFEFFLQFYFASCTWLDSKLGADTKSGFLMSSELAPKTFCYWLLTHLPNLSKAFVYLQPLTFYVGTPLYIQRWDYTVRGRPKSKRSEYFIKRLPNVIGIPFQIFTHAITASYFRGGKKKIGGMWNVHQQQD